MATALARSSYAILLKDVQKVLAEGRARAKTALEREEVRTWWEAAKVVNEHLRIHDGRASYGKKTVLKLAQDLNISQDYLYDVLRFQRVFPIFDSSQKLTLTHYRILSRIENSKEREVLLKEAIRGKLSARDLLAKVGSRKLLLPELKRKTVPKSFALKPRRGNFYTYRIVKPRDLYEHHGFYSIDLGFTTRIDLKLAGLPSPKEGDIIEAIRTEKNERGDRYWFKKSSSGPEALYTYKATVENVIDDDTLWTHVDLGFRVWTKQKLRLRGIDAAEIEKGKPASDFVKRTLARVPFAVVTVTGRDKFNRPLTDVFYLEGTEDRQKVLREGTYLNQELLDRGLAKRV